MKSSIRRAAALASLALILAACSQPAREQESGASSTPKVSPIEHGEYLTTKVGMCQDCHTPRKQTGEFDKEKWLAGSMLGFAPSVPIPGFSQFAPKIAGLPSGWSEADMVKFLQTGKRMDGTTPNPPMPEYRLSKEDAEAMTAYLISLGKPAGQ